VLGGNIEVQKQFDEIDNCKSNVVTENINSDFPNIDSLTLLYAV